MNNRDIIIWHDWRIVYFKYLISQLLINIEYHTVISSAINATTSITTKINVNRTAFIYRTNISTCIININENVWFLLSTKNLLCTEQLNLSKNIRSRPGSSKEFYWKSQSMLVWINNKNIMESTHLTLSLASYRPMAIENIDVADKKRNMRNFYYVYLYLFIYTAY